jgi:hypothetical protein
MKRTTTWGVAGAALFVVVGILCSLVSYDSVFHDAAHSATYVCYPVIVTWMAIFKIFGIEGDQGMAYILPMLATMFLYLAAIGYGLGALVSRVLRPR